MACRLDGLREHPISYLTSIALGEFGHGGLNTGVTTDRCSWLVLLLLCEMRKHGGNRLAREATKWKASRTPP